MKTAIIIPVWKRPKVTSLCFENIAKTGFDVFVGTNEQWAFDLCKKYGFTTVWVENDYLGRKKNSMLDVALLDNFEWDQLMELGSDNLVNLDILDEYLSIDSEHYGPSCLYFADPKNKRAKYYNTPRKIWGAGRVVSRQAVEKAVPLWDDKGQIYLDAQANEALSKAGYPYSVAKIPLCVDIKTEVNIHSYRRFNGVSVDYEKITETFAELDNYDNLSILTD